jgi:hypothetical protein
MSQQQRRAGRITMLLKHRGLVGRVYNLARRAAAALQDGVLDQAEEDSLVDDFRAVLRAARNHKDVIRAQGHL